MANDDRVLRMDDEGIHRAAHRARMAARRKDVLGLISILRRPMATEKRFCGGRSPCLG